MGMTVEQLLYELEKPENESEIKHLANLKHLDNLKELDHMKGVGGIFARFIASLASKHTNAFIALAECKDAADIVAFKQTSHYAKIKSSEVGSTFEMKDLKKLEELQNLNFALDNENDS